MRRSGEGGPEEGKGGREQADEKGEREIEGGEGGEKYAEHEKGETLGEDEMVRCERSMVRY